MSKLTAQRKRISKKVAKKLRYARRRVAWEPIYATSVVANSVYMDYFNKWQDEMRLSIMGSMGIPREMFEG